MCDIVTLAGVALSGASAIANSSAASQAAKARSKAMNAERQRQTALRREAGDLNDNSRAGYEDFEGQREQRGTQLGDYFQQQAERPVADANTAAVMPSTSNIVLAETNKQNTKARDFTNNQGAALGQLRAFGDVLGSRNLAQARNSSQIGQINGFMGGSSSILPYELDAAAQKGAGAKLLGDLLGGAGSLATRSGLSGGTFNI